MIIEDWVCPLCGGLGRVGSPLPETCKIPERSIGNECLAMRQLDLAAQILDGKKRALLRRASADCCGSSETFEPQFSQLENLGP